MVSGTQESSDATSTLVLTLAYDGARFAGFARQPGLDTVQGRIESALTTVFGRAVETTGAGRTDAGVHALGQVVSAPLYGENPDPHALLRSLNALVGEGVAVTGVTRAVAGFSARHSAIRREYRYTLVSGPVPPLFLRSTAWWVKRAHDVGAMRDACALLVGEHDFRSFCVAESAKGRVTRRRIEKLEIYPDVQLGEHAIVVRVVGNAFLHSMVRVIVGSLVEVGSGRRPAGWIADVLESRDRSAAGPTAPPHGLVLWRVEYAEDPWIRPGACEIDTPGGGG